MKILQEEYGLKLNRYIPNFTYLERITESQIKRINNLPYFRWNGTYQPGYKISAKIGENTFETRKRRAERGLVLVLVLHNDTSIDTVATKLRSNNVQILKVFDLSELNTESRIRVRILNPNKLATIAKMEEIVWIEENPASSAGETGAKVSHHKTAVSYLQMPLHSLDRWQGVLEFEWFQKHTFTENEKLLMSQLVETLAAHVAIKRLVLIDIAIGACHITACTDVQPQLVD